MEDFKEGLAKSLGQKLKKAREKAGLTQQQIASSLEITQPTYSQYEAGARLPSLEVFSKIVKLLGVSADFMLGGIDRGEIRLDEETSKIFEEFKELHQKNRNLFIELLALLKKYEAS